ncbi:MAG TPA: FAD-dependent oxidoreductase, partial [Pseudomonas sp.]|nr:FAD-dependent oxidoreductase [Pseudomonas sp.]
DFYPGLGERLLAATGIDPEVHVTGLYWLDLHDEVEALAWGVREGRAFQSVDVAEVRQRLPGLGPHFRRAIYAAGMANVRNPRLLKALRVALLAMPNVRLREQCPVVGFVHDNERIRGVITAGGELCAEHIVLAAGAWSGDLLKTLNLDLPIGPVKGQMILYKCPEHFLSAMVLAEGRYAIPRKDGHVLIGSTLEHVGFDRTPTDEALVSLKSSAEELLPGLADATVVGHWAGLRPGSPGGIPFVGEMPEYPGLWLNCGHYRNGLVLAPASCELLKNLMLREAPIIDPSPYSPVGRLG